jgi:hypothetical protein
LIFASGYALNFLGLPADPVPIFFFVCVGFILIARWLAGQSPRVAADPLEFAGFLLVFIGTWIYFVLPSLPTLVPPSYSGDPALHYAFTQDPGGPSLIVATFAHWFRVPILRAMHPAGTLWLALTAGGIYGIACAIAVARSAKPLGGRSVDRTLQRAISPAAVA